MHHVCCLNGVHFKVSSGGEISIVVGTCNLGGFSGDGGSATSAQLLSPSGVAVSSGGDIFVADSYNQRIRKVQNGTLPSRKSLLTHSVMLSQVNSVGMIATVAGSGSCQFLGDGGAATSASLCYPQGVAVTTVGDLFIVDNGNRRIRKVICHPISTIN